MINGTAPVTPFTTFQDSRGATFTTPGTGLTQAAATGGLLSLDLINPQYAALFAPFSPNRLFAPIGSNITDGAFSLPGTGGTTPAGVMGFGAVFSDVDLAGTSIAFATTAGGIGPLAVPTFSGNQTFSFLGILLAPGEGLITSVRIVTGTTALGPSRVSRRRPRGDGRFPLRRAAVVPGPIAGRTPTLRHRSRRVGSASGGGGSGRRKQPPDQNLIAFSERPPRGGLSFLLMSAIGTKRTSASALHMSAFGGKADIASASQNVFELKGGYLKSFTLGEQEPPPSSAVIDCLSEIFCARRWETVF